MQSAIIVHVVTLVTSMVTTGVATFLVPPFPWAVSCSIPVYCMVKKGASLFQPCSQTLSDFQYCATQH